MSVLSADGAGLETPVYFIETSHIGGLMSNECFFGPKWHPRSTAMPTRRVVLMSPLFLGIGSLIPRTGKAGTPWRMATEYPATSMPGEGVGHFARIVSHLSNGALIVQPGFDAPGGLRSAAMPRAVAEGRLEAADVFTGGLAAEAPIFGLSALPFLTTSTADTARLLRVARSSYEAVLTARGLVLLYATPWPPTGLWSR